MSKPDAALPAGKPQVVPVSKTPPLFEAILAERVPAAANRAPVITAMELKAPALLNALMAWFLQA